MKRLALLLMIAMLAAMVLPMAAAAAEVDWLLPPPSYAVTYKLMAGQYDWIGNVWVWVEDDMLHVRYQMFGNVAPPEYCLEETHVAFGDELTDIPQKNGNPVPGLFPYNVDYAGVTSVAYDGCIHRQEYQIPLGDLADTLPLYIATHAAITKYDDPTWEETGWGLWCGADNLDVYDFPGKNWAVYILWTGVPLNQ